MKNEESLSKTRILHKTNSFLNSFKRLKKGTRCMSVYSNCSMSCFCRLHPSQVYSSYYVFL